VFYPYNDARIKSKPGPLVWGFLVATVGAICALLAIAQTALARDPPIAFDSREGLWIGANEAFVQQTRDRWSPFLAPGTVNKIATDDGVVWVATDDGVIRFESDTRHSTTIGMDEGLPSQVVTTVAVDDTYVWFGTNKGLVRYRKLDRTLRVYTDKEGLPHRAINDAVAIGRQVWFATRNGLAVYDAELDGLRAYTTEDGVAGEDITELFLVGDDLWCITDEGLTRVRIHSRSFTNFSYEEIGGEEINAFVIDGNRIWIGTENGLISFEPSSDTFQPFPQQDALKSRHIVGIETFVDYLFIATDMELVRYHKPSRSIKRYTEADGLHRNQGIQGTALANGLLTLVFEEDAEVYDINRDIWITRTFETTSEEPSAVRVFGKFDGSMPVDLIDRKLLKDRYATSSAGFAFGQRFEDGRSLDGSLHLDYGQLELSGIRDLEYKLEYLGNSDDIVREVQVSDKHEYRTLEEGLERSLMLEGGKAKVATPGEDEAVSATVSGGRRRGAAMRDFLSGPRQEIYDLSQRYILPGSERVMVDGELLTNGTDYTIIYPAGQIAFLDPERVDDLSIIEVEYEYDLMPKKGLGVLSLLQMLPADREVGDWTRQGEARLISDESGLYQQIDGAAPKYIDRGWNRSVYVEYRQGSRTIQVAIHDMGDEVSAESIYDFDLPPAREVLPDRENLVVDIGQTSSYSVKAYFDSFYLELNIDEKSDSAKQSLKLFAIQILDRSESAGELTADVAREWLLSTRSAVRPYKGMEIGARVVTVNGENEASDTEALMGRRLVTGIGDARYETEFDDDGRLTAYSEFAGSSDRQYNRDGWAGMGRLRLSHPYTEGTLEGRHLSDEYTPIGTKTSLLGTLRDEARLDTTVYPVRWLPTTAFYTRQHALTEEGATGVVQHGLGRLRLAYDELPITSFQMGHTLVDDEVTEINRLRIVGQTDYDIPKPVLDAIYFKRIALRALYGVSEQEEDELGSYAGAMRVHLVRLEGKISPTSTESAYSLFRSRKVNHQVRQDGEFELGFRHWELNSGARSAIIPGLIPQVNYTIFFDDDREGEEIAKVVEAKTSITNELGIYPGEYWALLTPIAVIPRFSIANSDTSEDDIHTLRFRSYRFDNRAVYAGQERVELEFYQLYETAVSGPDSLLEARKLEFRQRLVYRPIFKSPITLRYNHGRKQSRNDLTIAPEAADFSRVTTNETWLEWLMRWTRMFTTQLSFVYSHDRTRDMVAEELSEGNTSILSFIQQRVGSETEIRIRSRGDELYLIQANGLYYLFGNGEGASKAVVYDIGISAIWMINEMLYLDSQIVYRQTVCLVGACTDNITLEPRMFLTVNM